MSQTRLQSFVQIFLDNFSEMFLWKVCSEILQKRWSQIDRRLDRHFVEDFVEDFVQDFVEEFVQDLIGWPIDTS